MWKSGANGEERIIEMFLGEKGVFLIKAQRQDLWAERTDQGL